MGLHVKGVFLVLSVNVSALKNALTYKYVLAITRQKSFIGQGPDFYGLNKKKRENSETKKLQTSSKIIKDYLLKLFTVVICKLQ